MNTLPAQTPSTSLSMLVDAFLSEQDVAESSRETYRKGLARFMAHATQQAQVSREMVLAYKRSLEHLSPFTAGLYLTVAKKFFAWAEHRGLCANVAAGVKIPKAVSTRTSLSVEQANELLSTMRRETLEEKRNFALVTLALHTGMRGIELVRASLEDVQQQDGALVLRVHGKGRQAADEVVLLTGKVERALRDYLVARGDVAPCSPLLASVSDRNPGARLTTRTVRQVVKTHLRRIGLTQKNITPHSLRHTAITLVMRGGGSLRQAQMMGRHSSLDTTMKYEHSLSRIQDAPENILERMLA